MKALLNITFFTLHTHKSTLVDTMVQQVVPQLRQMAGVESIKLCHILQSEEPQALSLALLMEFSTVERAQNAKNEIVEYLSQVFHSQLNIGRQDLLFLPTVMEIMA